MNLKEFLKKTYLMFLKIISIIIPVKNNKITLITKFNSGCNVIPVYHELKKYKNLQVQFIQDDIKPNPFRQLILLFKLLRSKIIITTHKPKLKTKNNITIDLWHGPCLKALNLMSSLKDKFYPIKDIDYFNSYSEFFINIDNAAFGMRSQNYVTLGAPRNDYLFKQDKKLKNILNIKKNHKLIIYVPTWRDKEIQKDYDISFEDFLKNLGFNFFDIEKFNFFLKKNNLLFVLKPHPFENDFWKKILKELKLSNFLILLEDDLKRNKVDFYQILNQFDLIVTDYSSVYIDWLLIDKPIVFTPTDYEIYDKIRNIVLKPYDFWTPGPKCITQKDFEKEILKSLNDKNYYKKERETIKNIVHKHKDGNSTKRVADFIIKQIEK